MSISDLLSFYAKVERVGRTSITVNVEVYAERNPADLHVVKVTEANLTYVAIDRPGPAAADPGGVTIGGRRPPRARAPPSQAARPNLPSTTGLFSFSFSAPITSR